MYFAGKLVYLIVRASNQLAVTVNEQDEINTIKRQNNIISTGK